jgi:hypothetical protein
VVFVPDEDDVGALRPRLYGILADGGVFLVNLVNGAANGDVPVFEAVPDVARDAIRVEHPDRTLQFPPVLTRPEQGGVSVPAPAVPLLWVNPLCINLIYAGTDIRRVIHHQEEVHDGDWDAALDERFDETDVFKALEDHLVLGRPWEESPFYQRVITAINRGVTKFGCSTEEEFRERSEVIDRLYCEIAANGYRTQSELGTDQANDEIRVAIRRDGRFLFLDGRHRLAIARILGLPQVPVRVTQRHAEWDAFKTEVRDYAQKRGGRVYQVIDHPDLESIPAHHGTERVEFISAALADYDCEGKSLLDIGTHWGFMAQQMEKLGFDGTGVELSRRNARFAQQLMKASESRVGVWRGDIFEYPDAEKHEVVLELNVFHHLIKTEEKHEALKRFLARLVKTDVIFFEPHDHTTAQLRDAYRNYAPEEFAQFVGEHAGMSRIELLGHADDQRAVFMLRP